MRSHILSDACALTAAALALSISAVARADDSEADHTIFNGNTRHGGYGAPEVKLTTLTGDAALLVGGQAGWIIDRHVVIGAAGYGLASTHTPDLQLQRPTGRSRIELGYGGVRVGYIFTPQDVVHVTTALLIGGGGLAIATRAPTVDEGVIGYRWDHHDGAPFIALEPQAEVEINLAKHVRLAVSGSYRYLGDTVKPGLRASDISGFAGGLSVKIGVF